MLPIVSRFPSRRRLLLAFLIVSLVCILLVSGLFIREARQQRLDAALIAALKSRKADGALALLAQGATPNARDAAAPPSTWRGWLEKLRHRSPPVGDLWEHPYALTLALKMNDGQKLQVALLDRGADVHCFKQEPFEGWTPLMWASDAGYTNTVHTMLAHGAEVNERGGGEQTALLRAAVRGHEETVRVLIAGGADINVQQKKPRNDTPLMVASEYGQEGMVKLLLQKGGRVNIANDDGITALMRAIETNEDGVVRILLARGADVHARTRRGTTPLRLSRMEDNPEIEAILVRAGAKE